MDITDYLLEYKKREGIGFGKLAKRADLDLLTIMRISRREKVPTAKTCIKLAKLLNISFSEAMSLSAKLGKKGN